MFQRIILKVIRVYQGLISPNLAKHCRFYPSCSEYTYLAVKKYGLFKGSWKGGRRIIKCYPWHPGGIDFP